MCYALLLSTTSSDDLSQLNNDAVKFNAIPERLSSNHLLYLHKWYIGSRTGCSCSFRHLYGPEFEFGVPEDWFPEEQSDIEATLQLIRWIRSLITKGEKVDCIDLWESDETEPLPPMPIHLKQIRDEEFRFFENHHFNFME